MKKVIAACGNDCATCPRYMPISDDELHKTAILWEKIGYRDHVVTNEEIKCTGCKKENYCRYGIIDCVADSNLHNCGECSKYPCSKIEEAFIETMRFEPACRKNCTKKEYDTIAEAFFRKKDNLDYVKSNKNVSRK